MSTKIKNYFYFLRSAGISKLGKTVAHGLYVPADICQLLGAAVMAVGLKGLIIIAIHGGTGLGR